MKEKKTMLPHVAVAEYFGGSTYSTAVELRDMDPEERQELYNMVAKELNVKLLDGKRRVTCEGEEPVFG